MSEFLLYDEKVIETLCFITMSKKKEYNVRVFFGFNYDLKFQTAKQNKLNHTVLPSGNTILRNK